MEPALASIFTDGSAPPSPISWGIPRESTEKLQHQLMCASMELDKTKEDAEAQEKINEAKLFHLHSVIENTRNERDRALQECKKLKELILHLSQSSSPQVATTGSPCSIFHSSISSTCSSEQSNQNGPSSPEHVEALGQAKYEQPLTPAQDLHAFLMADAGKESVLDFDYILEPEKEHQTVIEASNDTNKEVFTAIGDLQKHQSMDFHVDKNQDFGMPADFQTMQSFQPRCEADLCSNSSWGSSLSTSSNPECKLTRQLSSMSTGASYHLPTSIATYASGQSSCIPRAHTTHKPMSISQVPMSPSRNSSCTTSSLPNAMALACSPKLDCRVMPLSSLAQWSSGSLVMSQDSAKGEVPSSSCPGSLTNKGVLSPSSPPPLATTARLSCSPSRKGKKMPAPASSSLVHTSALPTEPPNVGEPPELDLKAVPSYLPEKGKLLHAVIEAGPLLQTLLLTGPLPKWQCPPPQLMTVDILMPYKASTNVPLPLHHTPNQVVSPAPPSPPCSMPSHMHSSPMNHTMHHGLLPLSSGLSPPFQTNVRPGPSPCLKRRKQSS